MRIQEFLGDSWRQKPPYERRCVGKEMEDNVDIRET